MRRSAAVAVAAAGLLLLCSPALPLASSTAAQTETGEASNEAECFSTVQTAHPRAGLVGGVKRHLAEGAPKTTEERVNAYEADILKGLGGSVDGAQARGRGAAVPPPPMELDGLARHFKTVYEKMAELEARLEQVEEESAAKSAFIQGLEERLQGKEALLQEMASEVAKARGDREAPRRAAGEERAAALRRGQQRALSSLLRRAGSSSGMITENCVKPQFDVGMDKQGLVANFGRYACAMDFDLGWYGNGSTDLFDLDLNFGRKPFPPFLRNLQIFSKMKTKMRELFPTLPELTSTFFDELCDKVVDHLSAPAATAATAEAALLETKHSSVRAYRRGLSALQASGAQAVAQEPEPRPRPHNTIIGEPEKCLFFKKNGERERTDFWTMDSFFGPCEDIKDLSPDVSLGVQSKIEKWRPEQCFNHTTTFNLPIAAAAGAGIVFDVLPPTVTTNFWGCFADFMQIVQGKGSMAVFGLEVLAFGLEVVDTRVPIDNPIAKWSCYVAGLQEDAQPGAAANFSYAEFQGAPPKPGVSMQEVKVDMRSKKVSRERRLSGDEARRTLARAMKRRPPAASLAEAGADARARAEAEAEAGTQQLFELRLGDVPNATEKSEGLTVIDNDAVGLALRGRVKGGKLSVGLDLRVGELIDTSEDFELLDFHSVVKGGMSILECVNPCFTDLAIKAWEDHIENFA